MRATFAFLLLMLGFVLMLAGLESGEFVAFLFGGWSFWGAILVMERAV
jgi:hypothetical protein